MNLERYDRQNRIKGWDQEKLSDATLAIFGAGATGTVVGLASACMGVGKIIIFDNDKIETTNLNRQFLYYDRIGENKAEVLAEKLEKINTDIKVVGNDVEINDLTIDLVDSQGVNVMADCFDNFRTRVILNNYAIKRRVPLVSGGTAAHSGQVLTYFPGKTPCLDCQLDINKFAIEESSKKKMNSCNLEPEPSIVTTNALVGALMATEIRKVLLTLKGTDTLLGGILMYNEFKQERFGYLNSTKKEGCTC